MHSLQIFLLHLLQILLKMKRYKIYNLILKKDLYIIYKKLLIKKIQLRILLKSICQTKKKLMRNKYDKNLRVMP